MDTIHKSQTGGKDLPIAEAQRITEGIVGTPIRWEPRGDHGFIPCPFSALHSKPSKERSCKIVCVKLPDLPAPGAYCFHQSCKDSLNELSRQIQSALGRGKPQEHCRRPLMVAPAPNLAKWPEQNDQLISEILTVTDAPRSLASLRALSPVHFEESTPDITEGIIDRLFPGDPLLCCAAHKNTAETRPRSRWRGKLARLQFIVPSPMIALMGKRMDGTGHGARTRSNTGQRVHLVVEFDKDKRTGKDRPIGDQCAILWHLNTFYPLVLALHSGGKSVHGWFSVPGVPEATLKHFFRYAVSLGADEALWKPEQLVRMPHGVRTDKGKPYRRQTVFYFAPEEVKL